MKRFLIVGDNRTWRVIFAILVKAMKDYGCGIKRIGFGKVADDIKFETGFDMVVLDFNGLNPATAFDALSAIKYKLPLAKVIAMLDDGDAHQRFMAQELMGLGILNDTLVKPSVEGLAKLAIAA